MTLEPLLTASPMIQGHAFAAIAAFALGAVQLIAPKGTIPHRAFGWLWVLLMLAVAGTSLFIHTIQTWGLFSPIHLLSVFVLVEVPIAVWAARTHRIARHRFVMTSLFIGALVIAGGFTFYPGRIMYRVVFGG